jgi:mannan endo-1,4-beta-mannosidase
MYVERHVALARTLGKPIVLEEFGLSRDDGAVDALSPTTARDAFFAFLSDVLYHSARSGSPLAGSNFWTWDGEAHVAKNENAWRPDEPVPGDPPHEPQGFNSVYESDGSTLAVLSAHAASMKSIGDPLV